MPAFSQQSMKNLKTCHPQLQLVALEVVKTFDCSVLEGHRGEALQNQYFSAVPQLSKVNWPNSAHNVTPSDAIHLVPYPFPGWKKLKYFYVFSGYVMATAVQMGISLIWGGDWDGDWNLDDQQLNDLIHFERVKTE